MRQLETQDQPLNYENFGTWRVFSHARTLRVGDWDTIDTRGNIHVFFFSTKNKFVSPLKSPSQTPYWVMYISATPSAHTIGTFVRRNTWL